MDRGTTRGGNRGRGAFRGGSRGRGGNIRGRGTRGRFPGRGRGTPFTRPTPMETDQRVDAVNRSDTLDVNTDPKQYFVNASVTLDQHIQAQTTNLPRYLAMFFALQENGVEIGQKAKACALAAAWCRHDHQLANNLLLHREMFTLTEVLKAVTMLDAARQVRVYEKQLKRLELSATKPNPRKVGKLKNNIDNLNKLKASTGSASGAIARHIQRWTRTLTQQELEYFALHMPTEPWKKLADIVHFHPGDDFPALPWFLPFCFGTAAPADSMVARCRDLTNENVNELIKEFPIPYSHLKQFKDQLTEKSKAKIAEYEEKLDTVLWYYEDLQCQAVDDILSERLRNGEQITLPYGKLMERLMLLRTINEARQQALIIRQFTMRRGRQAAPSLDAGAKKSSFYADLLLIAEAQLKTLKLPLGSPVAVLGDASSSMNVAIRTATILSSLLTAICSAKLSFFNTDVILPAFTPKTIEDVLTLALTTTASGSTANAAGLLPYYNEKEVIKTFIMVTDEEENTPLELSDGSVVGFFDLFMKYREDVYPAKLVFISFLKQQHAQGQIYQQFKDANVPDVVQVCEHSH